MKLNNRGWGYRMMFLLMSILIIFFAIAIYLIYEFYTSIERNKENNIVSYVEVIR